MNDVTQLNDQQPLNIGIFGAFDFENYGDLLFPLLAEHELSQRLGAVKMHIFAYHNKTKATWPFAVTSLTELATAMQYLDGVLIGGGHVIRFDKSVVPGYFPPSDIHHPTGFWLAPILMALQKEIPVAWNAPGVLGPIPEYFSFLMKKVLNESDYISVRDTWAKEILVNFSSNHDEKITISPDTAFNIPKLIDIKNPSAAFLRLKNDLQLTRPYIFVQPVLGLEGFIEAVRKSPDIFKNFQLVAVPIGPVLGDNCAILTKVLPDIISLTEWPHPLVMAELIAHAAAVVGTSLHLSITAVSFGVPNFRPVSENKKYALLADCESVHHFQPDGETATGKWFVTQLQKTKHISLAVKNMQHKVDQHWDHIAVLFKQNYNKQKFPVLHKINQMFFWQSLASELEKPFEPYLYEFERLKHESKLIKGSIGWKIVVLLKKMAVKFPHLASLCKRVVRTLLSYSNEISQDPMINTDRILQYKIETHPYQWTMIDGLFSPENIAALSQSYPTDRFKIMAGYDGEKGYQYEARSLIHLGANKMTHPRSLSKSWRRFATDLLSSDYRQAISKLTGINLMNVPMEANVLHYGPGAWLGPHLDLKDKIVTHVFYFNEFWKMEDGGCLLILNSQDMKDVAAKISPVMGNSSILVRSNNSWHAVDHVAENCTTSRRSVIVTFYQPNANSPMWPPGGRPKLYRTKYGNQP